MQPSTRDHRGMAQFSGKSIMSVDQLAIGYNTASNTGAQRDHNKIAHAPRGPIHHFTNSSSIGIVGKRRGKAEPFRYKLGDGNYAFPVEIGCVFDSAGIKIS